MVGAFATGKTSLVLRYVHSIFSEKYLTTVGVKIDRKTVNVNNKELNLIVWDIHGEDDFQKVRMSYLRGSSGYFLVVDGTRSETLEKALELQNRVEEVIGQVPFILVLNKWDLQDEWEIETVKIDELLQKEWNIVKTSAKNGIGVEEIFQTLAIKLLEE